MAGAAILVRSPEPRHRAAGLATAVPALAAVLLAPVVSAAPQTAVGLASAPAAALIASAYGDSGA